MAIRELSSDLSPLHTRKLNRHNLPIQVTSFIGRERDIADVKRLLLAARLVTLIGSGGAGKTRLALQVAAGQSENFYDGIWMIELAPLANPALVLPTVATTLGLREQPGRPILDVLLDTCSHQNLLLILDNCEHLIQATAQLADAILHSCPDVKILATSREPLGVAGETPYRVPSLALPDTLQLPSTELFTQYDAVRLFVDRAALWQPTFHVTTDNAPAVAQICSQLGGIPLALELAAARIRVLSVEQIAERLNDRFRLLTGGSRTALPRQQTLRAAIDWSYSLLVDAERILLQRLSVFVGGWSLEAAEEVASDQDSGHPEDVLDLLTRLVDKSLVSAEAQGGGAMRHEMLETIRQYAREKLEESGQAAHVQNRHLEFFSKLVEQAEERVQDDENAVEFNQLELEHDNLRAALDWTLTPKADSTQGLRLASALAHFWGVRGYFQEGREYLTALLAKRTQDRTEARAQALEKAGYLGFMQGDYPAARAVLDTSLEIYRELGLASCLPAAAALNLRGYIESEVGEYAIASELMLQGLAIRRASNDDRGVAHALRDLGACAIRAGDYATASRYLEEARSLLEQIDPRSRAMVLTSLAEIQLRRGNYTRAGELEQESLTLRRALGDKWGIAVSLGNSAWVFLKQGDLPQAVGLLRESIMLRREIGDPGGIAWCLEKLAQVALSKAHTKSTRERRENFQRAARLFGAAAGLRAPGGLLIDLADQPEYEQQLTVLRTQLGEPAFEAMWAKGNKMPLARVLDDAFAATEPAAREAQEDQSIAARRSQKQAFGGLTTRQRQVAALVAQGKANRTIAVELVVSERTVENHVANIMSKLGLSSRTQIAVWAVEQGLTIADNRP